jgi:formylglycine-generating enzyme required for sulfatase activity
MICNGQDYDPAQDATIATGTATSCYANDSLLTGGTSNDHGFDMSGNVKEWVLAEQPGHNPIRGGAANNTGQGIACALNFTLADDTFFLSNVGFRCCK